MALMKAMCAYSAIPHSLNEHTFIVNGAASGSFIFTFYCSKKVFSDRMQGGRIKNTFQDKTPLLIPALDQPQMNGKYPQLSLSDAGPDPSMTCSRVSPMQPQCSLEI